MRMNQASKKTTSFMPRHLLVVAAGILVVATPLAELFGGSWRQLLGWAVMLIATFFAIVCGEQAVDTFELRQHTKHDASKQQARRMLYIIIGRITQAMLVIAVGAILSDAIDPGL